jgi:uncharacterized membrane protein
MASLEISLYYFVDSARLNDLLLMEVIMKADLFCTPISWFSLMLIILSMVFNIATIHSLHINPVTSMYGVLTMFIGLTGWLVNVSLYQMTTRIKMLEEKLKAISGT